MTRPKWLADLRQWLAATNWAMRFQRRSGGLRPEPIFVVSALRAPAAIAGSV